MILGPEVVVAAGSFVGAMLYAAWKAHVAGKHGKVTADAAVATVEALARVEGAIGTVNANLGTLTHEVAEHRVRLRHAERRLGISWSPPDGSDAAALDD